MGLFSWETSDTNESISNSSSNRGALEVKMLDDKGNEWIEKNYEGYGDFGGKDFYELLAEMNNLKTREEGIKLEFSENENVKFPKLVTINCNKKWHELSNSKRCKFQGFFY